LTSWRIGSSRFSASDSGGNAGRWNHKGIRVIYTASSAALAALEILANRTNELPDDYIAVSVDIPNDLRIITLSETDLPNNWRANPHPVETRNLGGEWSRDLKSAVLGVPSAVIPWERNYILNPAHSSFDRIRFGEPKAFRWDDRLRRRTP
jgi:RES domain-containing protein